MDSQDKYSSEYWCDLLKSQARSDLDVAEWCRENGVSINLYYYWINRLNREMHPEIAGVSPDNLSTALSEKEKAYESKMHFEMECHEMLKSIADMKSDSEKERLSYGVQYVRLWHKHVRTFLRTAQLRSFIAYFVVHGMNRMMTENTYDVDVAFFQQMLGYRELYNSTKKDFIDGLEAMEHRVSRGERVFINLAAQWVILAEKLPVLNSYRPEQVVDFVLDFMADFYSTFLYCRTAN